MISDIILEELDDIDNIVNLDLSNFNSIKNNIDFIYKRIVFDGDFDLLEDILENFGYNPKFGSEFLDVFLFAAFDTDRRSDGRIISSNFSQIRLVLLRVLNKTGVDLSHRLKRRFFGDSNILRSIVIFSTYQIESKNINSDYFDLLEDFLDLGENKKKAINSKTSIFDSTPLSDAVKEIIGLSINDDHILGFGRYVPKKIRMEISHKLIKILLKHGANKKQKFKVDLRGTDDETDLDYVTPLEYIDFFLNKRNKYFTKIDDEEFRSLLRIRKLLK